MSSTNLIKNITMKNIYLLITMSFLLLISCNQDEFLDKQPYDKIITENIITDFNTFEAAAKGVYENFQNVYYYGSYYMILSDLMSDNVKNNNYSVFADIDKYQTTVEDRYAQRTWDKIAAQIAQCSIVIRQAEEFDFGFEQEDATKLIGQLYVVRSLAYFDMQRLFAQPYNFTADASHLGVPIIDEEMVGIEIISPARSTTAEVYTKIINDIEKGIEIIGDDTSSIYFINKNSAKALLARINLYMENWEAANNFATEVINGSYDLVSNTDYVSSWADDFTSESIFSIVNTDTDNTGFSSMTYYYGRPRYYATDDLFNSLDVDDVRKNLITANKVLKYPAYTTRDNNIPVIRLSEMYLIQAEALSEMGGANEDAAKTAINKILLRSNPAATPYTETGDALKNVIEVERRKELMFEGHRLFDLTRKKKSFTKYSTSVGLPIDVPYPNNLTILPIPQTEVDANENISEDQQNAGY